jgi:hypothetical protein
MILTYFSLSFYKDFMYPIKFLVSFSLFAVTVFLIYLIFVRGSISVRIARVWTKFLGALPQNNIPFRRHELKKVPFPHAMQKDLLKPKGRHISNVMIASFFVFGVVIMIQAVGILSLYAKAEKDAPWGVLISDSLIISGFSLLITFMYGLSHIYGTYISPYIYFSPNALLFTNKGNFLSGKPAFSLPYDDINNIDILMTDWSGEMTEFIRLQTSHGTLLLCTAPYTKATRNKLLDSLDGIQKPISKKETFANATYP